MAGQYWADDPGAAKVQPDSSQLQMGLLEGKPIVVSWINWLLNILHAAYYLGTYFIAVIKIGTPSGGTTNLTIKTNDGATTLATITGTKITSEVPVEIDGTSNKQRIVLVGGPRLVYSASGGVGLFYEGYDVGNGPGSGNNIPVWSLTGNASPKRTHYMYLMLDIPYNTTDDPEAGEVLYKDPIYYATIETNAPGTSPDNDATLEFGYINKVSGEYTVLSSSTNDMETVTTVDGDSVVVLGSSVTVYSHDFNTKDRRYFLRLKFVLGTSEIVAVRNMYCSIRSYTVRGG